jgi:hypothetical protein
MAASADDEALLRLAFTTARKARENGNHPFGNHAEKPTLGLPGRLVFAAGQRQLEVVGPLPEDEIAVLREGVRY